MRLVLGSASPRRAALLDAAGFAFETIATDIDERVRAGESPAGYVRRLAAEKSAAALALVTAVGASRPRPEALIDRASGFDTAGVGVADDDTTGRIVVLAADTAVVVDGGILGKPRDDGEAADMLRRLSGRSHEVMTGVSVRTGAHEEGCVETTVVEFAALTPADIAWYVRSGEGRDKAGGYAVQGLASRFAPRVHGSYSNVVGLPVATVHTLLQRIASSLGSGYSQQ